MQHGRLLGPLLLGLGSLGLLMPEGLVEWLSAEDMALASLTLASLGAGLWLSAWRTNLADAPFQGYAALRQIGRSAGAPSRRMKIRIRCAR